MADFDTAVKRYSGFGIDLPWPVMLIEPSGAIGSAQRLALLRKYAGFPFVGGIAYGTSDLETDVAFYLRTLLPGEQTDDFVSYINGVRASTGETDDLNTAMWIDLNF